MNIDVVIGNPPYNNDIYIPFVEMGHSLASTCSVFITPAKWQAKGGKDNERFREKIVPHMSKIVYYPNCADIFDICERGGISYYIINKYKSEDIKIRTIDVNHELLCGEQINFQYVLHNNIVNNIIDKVNKQRSRGILPENTSLDNKYKVFTNLMICSAQAHSLYPKENVLLLLNPMYITEENKYKNSNFKILFSSNSKEVCNYFISYIYTKIIRFMLYCGLCGNSITNNETWRFVPDPGAFDHIFTDEELYKKYNLTPEEINIIESVIKERK